jgi:hypothetical protein
MTSTERVYRELAAFFQDAAARGDKFFNEAELQHEMGYWLRTKLPPDYRLFFERPSEWFNSNARGLVKKEIDLVVAPPAKEGYVAIELKCPRNGRHPETMFDACCDLQFLEQLVEVGFLSGLFAMHVDDPCFYQNGSIAGIYGFFRAARPLTGAITKPTGSKAQIVNLKGTYGVQWRSNGGAERYWLQQIARLSNKPLQLPESYLTQ